MPKSRFRRTFVWWWGILTLLPAVPLSCVGLAFSIYRSPQTLSDYLLWGYWLAMGSLMVCPGSALAAFGIAKLVEWYLGRGTSPSAPPACRSCGYDLTGNVSGTCPECGTAVGDVGAKRPFSRGHWLVYVIIGCGLATWLRACCGL